MSKKKKTVKVQDAFQNPLTRTGIFTPNYLEATDYPLTRHLTQNQQLINALYRSHWVIRRIIDVIPEDMMKNGYKIICQLTPEQLKKLEQVNRRTRLSAKILEGLKWGRLYGGAAGIILIRGHEEILDKPLDYDEVVPNSFAGLLIVDRWSGISPESELVDDISSAEFGMPKYYTITTDGLERGIKVHHSRVCRFIGRDLPYLELLAETYWGASEIEHVYDELRKRDNVSWNMAMLTFMANLRVYKMNGMEQILALGNEKEQMELYATMQAMNAMMNNNALQIIGSEDNYESHQYTFGGLADVYDRFMMDLAGAAETPVTKLFGRSPAGMNATGEFDMNNYYDTIEEKQEAYLRPVYDKILPVMMISTFGKIPDDFDYQFNPVRRPRDEEMADLSSKNTDSITKAYQAGLISQQVGLKELRQQAETTGMWSNITDEDINKAEDEPMNASEGMQLPFDETVTTQDSDWDETKHPRQPDGKFGKGGSQKNFSQNNKKDEKNDIIKNMNEAYAKQVASHGGSGNIKPDKVHNSHGGNPRQAEPFNIIDHKRDDTKRIDKRAFYDSEGRIYLEIHPTNHGNAKQHSFGKNGEHAHDIVWKDNKPQNGAGRELTETERKDNGDML